MTNTNNLRNRPPRKLMKGTWADVCNWRLVCQQHLLSHEVPADLWGRRRRRWAQAETRPTPAQARDEQRLFAETALHLLQRDHPPRLEVHRPGSGLHLDVAPLDPDPGLSDLHLRHLHRDQHQGLLLRHHSDLHWDHHHFHGGSLLPGSHHLQYQSDSGIFLYCKSFQGFVTLPLATLFPPFHRLHSWKKWRFTRVPST